MDDHLAKATLEFTTHAVSITVNEFGRIFCFKYTHNHTRCDWDIFYSQLAAAEFIVEPFSDQYHLILRGETGTN